LAPGLHCGFAVLPGQHFADVQARAREQRELAVCELRAVGEFAQAARVIECEAQAVDGAFEQQQQSVAAIDQTTAPALLQLEHETVVRAEQLRGGAVAQAFHRTGSNRTSR
jgi:hypothetical protein